MIFFVLITGTDFHCLLIPYNFLFISLDLMVQFHDSSLIFFDFFGDVFVSFGFGDHILLNIFFIIHVKFGHLLQLQLLESDLTCYGFVVTFLIGDLAHIQTFTLFLQLCKVGLKTFNFLLILLFLNKLDFQIFFMLFQLFLDDSSIGH